MTLNSICISYTYIDHTNLHQEVNKASVEKLCREAIENNFASVCINPVFVKYASEILNKEEPKVCTVVGFPLGAAPIELKFAESRYLIHQGAEELDMVINISALKEGDRRYIQSEIEKVVAAADADTGRRRRARAAARDPIPVPGGGGGAAGAGAAGHGAL